ncbi:hypothetical protein D9M68_773350 [compost metagenome]
MVELPGGTSSNLAAQAGVFTVSQMQGEALHTFLPVSVDQVSSVYRHELSLQQFTLPFAEAPELLEACRRLGISGSTLFPGYEGVAREVKDWARISFKGFDPDEIGLRELF